MDSWGWLEPRAADELWARQFGGFGNDDNKGNDSKGGGGGGGFGGGRNSSQAIVDQFIFASAKSIRTSTIILSVFNVVAASATALGIIWDSYAREKRNNPKFKFRMAGFGFIKATETFPLVLSVGIVVQGIVFAVAQSTGLKGLLILGCTITSQFMLPAVFIVPYIQLVFGVEVALRALRRRPFPVQSKWTGTICLAIVGTLLLANYLTTHFIRPPALCFGSLFFFVNRYGVGCFAVLTSIAVVLLIATVVIFLKLHRTANVDAGERIAASRMVYYLAVAVISTTLLIPYFFNISFFDQRSPSDDVLQLSMVASVVANVSGLMTGGLHLFLRSRMLSTIGPKASKGGKYGKYGEKQDDDKQNFKRGIRIWTPNNDPTEFGINTSRGGGAPRPVQRVDSTDTLINSEKEEEAMLGVSETSPEAGRMNPLRANAVFQAIPMPMQPGQVKAKGHGRKGSYNLFPGSGAKYDATSKSKEVQLNDEALKPPPSIHGTGGVRHRRDSSMASSATVQIGLRLSNVEDMPPLNSRYFQDTGKVYSLDCPNAKKETSPGAKRPSPLSTEADTNDAEDQVQQASVASVDSEKDQPKDCKLSPTVYDPKSPTNKSKVTSPKGVGFNVPARANLNSPRGSPSAAPQQSSRVYNKSKNKPDWI